MTQNVRVITTSASAAQAAAEATAAAALSAHDAATRWGGGVFDVTHPNAGAVGDAVQDGAGAWTGTDNTAAFQAAIDAAEAVYGTVVVPAGDFLCGSLTVSDRCKIVGAGKMQSRIIATGTGYLFDVDGIAFSELKQNRGVGFHMEGLRLDGNGRSVDCGAIQLTLADRVTIAHMEIRHFAREALRCSRGIRESVFFDWYVNHCGHLGNGYPSIGIFDEDAQDSNNLHFVGIRALMSWGHLLHIERDQTGGTAPIGSIFFTNCMFHGNEVFSAQAEDDGYDYTADESYLSHGHQVVRLVDARAIYFAQTRLNTSGRGMPLFYLGDGTGGASSRTNVTITNCQIGQSSTTWAGTFTRSGDTLVSTDAYLATGAIVRVETDGTLPAPLTAATDYYVIRVDDDTVELATSRANADAGTNITLTSAGSGTHTFAPRMAQFVLDRGDVRLQGCRVEAAIDGLAHAIVGPDCDDDAFLYDPTTVFSQAPTEGQPAEAYNLYTGGSAFDFVRSVGVGTFEGGLELENNTDLSLRQNDGTPVAFAKMTASDQLRLGDIGNDLTANVAIYGGQARLQMLVNGSAQLSLDPGQIKFGTGAPQAYPTVTGSAGGNAALQSLLTGLEAIGLITDSST